MGWDSSKYHIQYTLPDVLDKLSITNHPIVDTVSSSKRGMALQNIINRAIIGSKSPITDKNGPVYPKGRPNEDRILVYEISEDEAKLFKMLFHLTHMSWKHKIWEEIAWKPIEEIRDRITLLFTVI